MEQYLVSFSIGKCESPAALGSNNELHLKCRTCLNSLKKNKNNTGMGKDQVQEVDHRTRATNLEVNGNESQ